MSWGEGITTVRELLRAVAAGGRIVHTPRSQRPPEAWCEYRVDTRDGIRRPVSARVAIIAHAKGLVTIEHSPKGTTTP